MAKFKVGQRVRIKVCFHWPELSGTEGTIEEKDVAVNLYAGGVGIGYTVIPDVWGSSIDPRNSNKQLGVLEDQLEPLIKGSDKSLVAWDECCFDRDGKFKITGALEVV